MKKVLFVIGFHYTVHTCCFFVSNCSSNLINYIYLFFLNIMHFFSKRVVLFYCFEEMCISNILLDAPKFKAPPLTKIMPFKFEYNSNIDHIKLQNLNLVFQPF